jgi:CheY-like chemotaxis protein
MKPKTILLAEDNVNDVELTLLALSDQKLAHDIVVVSDGVEVMDYLRLQGRFSNRAPGNPVVILLDMKMPRMDGLEVLREVKGDPSLKIIPVVMITSSKEKQDLVQSYNLGVNAYVVKPVAFAKFIDTIKQVGTFWALLNENPGMN